MQLRETYERVIGVGQPEKIKICLKVSDYYHKKLFQLPKEKQDQVGIIMEMALLKITELI
jgi:hypothetical protein